MALWFLHRELAGLTGSDITKVIVFVTATFVLGVSLLSGIAILLMPKAQTEVLTLSPWLLEIAGILLLAVPLLYIAGTIFRRTPMSIGNRKVSLPRPSIAFAQIGVSIIDLSFAAARALLDTSRLISGGITRLLPK